MTFHPRGHPGEEAEDLGFKFAHGRRRSNSLTASNATDFKTKFEAVEQEPVFEEELHGPAPGDEEEPLSATSSHEKDSSADSMTGESIEEEDRPQKL